MTEEQLPLCECGCGEQVTKKGNRFIYGHNQRGKNNSFFGKRHTDKTRKQMSLDRSGDNHPRGMLGKRHSPETIEQYSKDRRGKNHHMYGKHHSDKTCKQISETNTNNPKLIGDIIVNHHYIYDHANPELYTMKVTRSKHAKIHMWMRKSGIIIPHINVTKENKDMFKEKKYNDQPTLE